MLCTTSTSKFIQSLFLLYFSTMNIWMLRKFFNYSRSTKNSYIRINMVHTLHWIKAIGLQPLESFKDMLTTKDYQKYVSYPMHGKTWYPLTTNVFVSFFFQIVHFDLLKFHIMFSSCIFPSLSLTFWRVSVVKYLKSFWRGCKEVFWQDQ